MFIESMRWGSYPVDVYDLLLWICQSRPQLSKLNLRQNTNNTPSVTLVWDSEQGELVETSVNKGCNTLAQQRITENRLIPRLSEGQIRQLYQ